MLYTVLFFKNDRKRFLSRVWQQKFLNVKSSEKIIYIEKKIIHSVSKFLVASVTVNDFIFVTDINADVISNA